MAHVRNLILVLGDQLTPTLSSLAAGDPTQDRILMAELQDEASYVRHHKKKIAFLFSAMRHFAEELRILGWTVDYVTLDDSSNRYSFPHHNSICHQPACRGRTPMSPRAGSGRTRRRRLAWGSIPARG